MADQQNMVDRPLRSVFIGNIPYEVTEEKLKEIFSEVGPVVSMKLVFDRDSGKPKGYGFCEYKDVETALSAMRNLNGYEINGRVLRVDNAGAERHRMAEMGNQGPNIGHNNGPSRHEMHGGNSMHEFSREMEMQPPVPEKTPEVITKAVASLPPEQMFELMKQMKLCIQNNPNEARNMLLQNPQLAYALLQAQVVMKIIDPATALAMLHQDNGVTVGTLMPEGQTGSMGMMGGPGPGRPIGGFRPPAPNPSENPWIAAGASAPLMPVNPPGPFGPGPGPMGGSNPPVGGDMDFRQMDPRMNRGQQQQGGLSQDMDLRDPRSQPDRFPVDPRQRDREMRDRDLRDRDMRGDRDLRMDRDIRPTGRDSDLRDRDLRDRDLRGDPRMQHPPVSMDPRMDPRARARAEREQLQAAQAQAQASASKLPSLPAGLGPAGTDSEKAALIMQVLQLSDEQIAMLPPEQRQSIIVLKEQIAKSAGGTGGR